MVMSYAPAQRRPTPIPLPVTTAPPALRSAAAPLAQLAALLNARVPRLPALPTNAVQRVALVQRIVDLNEATLKKEGSPPTYEQGAWFYKVYKNVTRAEELYATWAEADRAGIPVPAHSVIDVELGGKTLWAFRSKALDGEFFQFSKGHLAKIRKWIGHQTEISDLRRLYNIFTMVASTVGDGQGFFDPDGARIWFIDINMGGSTPAARDAAEYCAQRIDALRAAQKGAVQEEVKEAV